MNNLLKQDALEVLKNININWFKDKKILITGASGLLGINLISMLKQSELSFKCLVIINNTPELFFLNLIKDDDRFICNKCDLTEGLDTCLCYDVIFHLATYGQPAKIFSKNQIENQIKTITLNTEVVINLFKHLKLDGKFIFLSTSEVYQGLQGKHKEENIGTTTPQHVRACYIEAKRCGEAICNIYKNQGYNVKVIRLCLGYGMGVKITDRRVMNSFIFRALTDKKIDLMDSGSATRTYCYATNVLEMILNIMINGEDLVYNVGGEEIVSIKQLALNIGEILNVPISIPKTDDEIKGASNAVILNIDKYINEFSKPNFIDINEGLKRTIDWWKSQLGIN